MFRIKFVSFRIRTRHFFFNHDGIPTFYSFTLNFLPGESEDDEIEGESKEEKKCEEGEDGEEEGQKRNSKLDLCVASLKYIVDCHVMLTSMYDMPACPTFRSVQK